MFVAFFPLYGLRFASGPSQRQAEAHFKANAGGEVPSWTAKITPDLYVAARVLKRLGWRGNLREFYEVMR